MLINYMEVIVDSQLREILKKYGSNLHCHCDKCIEDIKAIALNHLKPLYAASNAGILYSKLNELETQFNVDIISEIIQAMEIVSKNPRHDKKE